jgi:hypothetical protein
MVPNSVFDMIVSPLLDDIAEFGPTAELSRKHELRATRTRSTLRAVDVTSPTGGMLIATAFAQMQTTVRTEGIESSTFRSVPPALLVHDGRSWLRRTFPAPPHVLQVSVRSSEPIAGSGSREPRLAIPSSRSEV